MTRTGSLQSDYTFHVSSDPAFVKPPVAPAKDATEEQVKAFTDAATDYIHKWKVARETTDYSALIVEGQTPKTIRLGRVNRKTWRDIQDLALLPGDCDRHVGPVAMMALLARLALRSIPHLDLKLDPVADKKYGWPMAPDDVLEILDEKDASIVGEIGNEVLRRLQGISPF